jgi:hypothetical protein
MSEPLLRDDAESPIVSPDTVQTPKMAKGMPELRIMGSDPSSGLLEDNWSKTTNDRVHVYPSPNGTVLAIGVTLAGEWVAEYRCHAEDFDERIVIALERRVRQREGRIMSVV